MKIFLTSTLIFSIAICAAWAEIKPLEYIELVSFPLEHVTELKWIVENIEKTPGDSDEDFVNFFIEAKKQSINEDDYQKKVVLDALDPKTPVSDEDVSFEAKCFIDITTIAFGSFKNYISMVKSGKLPKTSKKLFNYLKEYGFDKWRNCIAKDKIQLVFSSTLDKLDKVAERTFGQLFHTNERDPSENKLASVAEKVDFVKGKLNGKHMMAAMKSYLQGVELNLKATPKLLVYYIKNLCDKMYPTLVDFYDRYNLARAISPDRPKTDLEDSPTFKKLHEYARLCIQLLDLSTTKIAEEKIESSAG